MVKQNFGVCTVTDSDVYVNSINVLGSNHIIIHIVLKGNVQIYPGTEAMVDSLFGMGIPGELANRFSGVVDQVSGF